MRPRSNTRFKVSSSLRTAPGSDESESNGGSPLATSDNDSSNKLKKRSWPSRNEEPPLKARRQSEDRYSPRPSLNRLHIQQVQSKASTGDSVGMEHSSPWKNFKPGFPLSLEDLVIIAGGKDGYLVAVREISGRDPDEKIGMLQRIQCEGGNKNLLALRGSFSSEGKRYAVFEHEYFGEEDLFHKDMFKLSINLTQFALNGPYATEQQLAMILGQILDGLEYLATIGLRHGCLTCKNVLISTGGHIKLARLEDCTEIAQNRGLNENIRSIGYVAMEIMTKEVKYDGPPHVDDPIRWSPGSAAYDFVKKTGTAKSIGELKTHKLFDVEIQMDDIIDLRLNVYTAEFSVRREPI